MSRDFKVTLLVILFLFLTPILLIGTCFTSCAVTTLMFAKDFELTNTDITQNHLTDFSNTVGMPHHSNPHTPSTNSTPSASTSPNYNSTYQPKAPKHGSHPCTSSHQDIVKHTRTSASIHIPWITAVISPSANLNHNSISTSTTTIPIPSTSSSTSLAINHPSLTHYNDDQFPHHNLPDAIMAITSTSSTTTINYDLHCCMCNYQLKTLTTDQNCPECGLPIQQSLLLSQSTSQTEFVTLILRLAFFLIFSFRYLPTILTVIIYTPYSLFASDAAYSSSQWVNIIFSRVIPAVTLAILFYFAPRIATTFTKKDKVFTSNINFTPHTIVSITIFILGLYLLITSITDIAVDLVRLGDWQLTQRTLNTTYQAALDYIPFILKIFISFTLITFNNKIANRFYK
ncbi:hypothetical protein JD969_09205 [Planctomycetota bacterium]|nr:hypothetical protein JD969_09205 [Planctomycetota bacterium]